MLKLLIRTIGATFYQQHVGLFLVVFYLLFGMIQGYDLILFHKALLLSICSSPLNLLILFGIWILYAVKSLLFVRQKLSQEDYGFVKELTVVSKKAQIVLWIKVYSFLLIPVLCYATLVLITSVVHQYLVSLFATTGMLGLIMISLAIYTYRFSNFNFNVSKAWLNFPQLKINKPFWSWPIWYLLNEQRIMLLICKIVSFLFFKAILLVFADIPNDIRIYLTALLAVVLSHAVLILNLTKFDAFYNSFAKSLPINAITRLIYWAFVFGLLLIPELILLGASTGITPLQFVNCVLFCLGSMLVLQALVYLLKANTDRYLQYLLFFFFVSMFAIVGGYYLPFSIAMIIFTSVFYLWNYNGLDLKEIA
ncbi:hypothetical protein EZ428_15050 [Pedobacter frigiditerrae]|uniref:Uncharacterized protein n=1 Tax=Pedobacter frigiditerrae TaxID=2530452 RepID=A0A4R0MUS9_9SPHI|nr:hypothetical protein [Pedobacter frigiditerrae]TCC90583.1 hypothetical protein EZ428_15050 [Pedobacter frigiditerrae]